MSTCEKAGAEATSVVSSDRVSSLPPEIKGDILSRLLVEEAVRTSILSSTWRNAWTDMPKIFLQDGKLAQTKFVTLVDMVLALHKGTIEEFNISGNKSYHYEFARWMLMLSRRSPRSIIIKLNSLPEYRIPSCLFSIGNLKILHMENCTILLPRVFQGFKRLTHLSLKLFSSTDMDIQNLISFCPVLTDLRLVRFEGIRCLNIQAPELEYLEVVGGFEDINLDAPNLEWAVLTLNPKAKAYQSVPIAHDTKNYVKKSLGSHLSKGCIPMKLPAVFTRLEHIYLTICFWDERQVLTACSLFQNAPNLKRLDMRSRFSSPWYQDQASIQELTVQLQMDHLVTASLEGFAGHDYEVDFVAKLLRERSPHDPLTWAPALEELEIEWEGKTDCSRVLAKLLTLPRVSPRAKVIVTF
ncbi:hypothetical protein VPH35_056571 [Triticum aestivum]|uniref:F-box/FBD/LRR-repeat protein At1g13570 isoform X2 n=1 Tax=Triticum aestivum TaxID=4565 RepID=UPI001D01E3EE|nr:F-box/FBD/LRR-repeat protein At1g13570-like isoform X2 [Triticum aestivum]